MHAAGKLVIGGAFLAGATALGYLYHEGRVQEEIQRDARKELIALRASLTPETTHVDLHQLVDQTRHLFLVDAGHFAAVDTFSPSPFASARSILWLEYRGGWLCSAKLRFYDKSAPSSGGPPDLTFPCDALPNNQMQRTGAVQATRARR